MSDGETSSPYAERAAYVAANPDATFQSLIAEGPGVLAELNRNYPDRFEALHRAHLQWHAAGRPSSGIRTAPVQLAPAPRPEPVEPTVPAPDPASIRSMRDLVRLGAGAFNAFFKQHPERYAELAKAAGISPSRQ